ncbi:MAG: hypothetical protein EKK65_03385 [Lysobacterales bacterium]|nr:MAG: hypothetical protein EKK65_03385 [Xanthomonadales bacterium]
MLFAIGSPLTTATGSGSGFGAGVAAGAAGGATGAGAGCWAVALPATASARARASRAGAWRTVVVMLSVGSCPIGSIWKSPERNRRPDHGSSGVRASMPRAWMSVCISAPSAA